MPGSWTLWSRPQLARVARAPGAGRARTAAAGPGRAPAAGACERLGGAFSAARRRRGPGAMSCVASETRIASGVDGARLVDVGAVRRLSAPVAHAELGHVVDVRLLLDEVEQRRAVDRAAEGRPRGPGPRAQGARCATSASLSLRAVVVELAGRAEAHLEVEAGSSGSAGCARAPRRRIGARARERALGSRSACRRRRAAAAGRRAWRACAGRAPRPAERARASARRRRRRVRDALHLADLGERGEHGALVVPRADAAVAVAQPLRRARVERGGRLERRAAERGERLPRRLHRRERRLQPLDAARGQRRPQAAPRGRRPRAARPRPRWPPRSISCADRARVLVRPRP